MPKLVAAALLLVGAATSAQVLDLDGRTVDPFHMAAGAKAIVFLFTASDCPISNRYAPEVQRLYREFAPKGVRFWLVYPNPAETAHSIRDHEKSFGYPAEALRDPKQQLVKAARATVTPEAAIFVGGRLVYHGRIDDRIVDLGFERPAPTVHDLDDALTAILAGKPVAHPATQAVGCFIADMTR
ncbi:MAG TPA: redoxin domain-containing protein [Vicinamibacterales bacterium]|nr:redoxin domain-containing protein [Vicinamibacterales bacterium]